jgi:hypothetical protein
MPVTQDSIIYKLNNKAYYSNPIEVAIAFNNSNSRSNTSNITTLNNNASSNRSSYREG